MLKVYQQIIDNKKGDCMQACVASMLNKQHDEVPAFIEKGEEWFTEVCKYLDLNGYGYQGNYFNDNYSRLFQPEEFCFKTPIIAKNMLFSSREFHEENGIDGLFMGVVLSPKYFKNLDDHQTHAVVVDKDCNVIFDPNPEYKNIIEYPYGGLIGYNGVLYVYDFEKEK